MNRPATSVSAKRRPHHAVSKRPNSVASFSYLKESRVASRPNSTGESSWRNHLEIPSKVKSKPEMKTAGNGVQGFNVHGYIETYPEGNPQICVNGTPSQSAHSKSILKTLNHRKSGSSEQASSSDDEETLDEVIDLEMQSLDRESSFQSGLSKTPLCWDDVVGQRPAHISTKSHVPAQNESTLTFSSPDVHQTSTVGCQQLSPLTPAVSIKVGSSFKNGCTLLPHETSSLVVDVLLTWQDRCILPWKPSLATKDSTETSAKGRLKCGLQVDGQTALGEEETQCQGLEVVQSLLKRMILHSPHQGMRDDLLCIWLRCPSKSSTRTHFSLDSGVFDVYISQSTSNQISTRIVEQQSPVRVVHNLYVLKFNLSVCLPWISGVESVLGRNLEVLLHLVKPDRFNGCVCQELVHLPTATPPTLPTSSNTLSTEEEAVQEDKDRLTVALDSTTIDPSNPKAQDYILSLYNNPYQLSKHQEGNRPSKPYRQTYTDIVYTHVEDFMTDRHFPSYTASFKNKSLISNPKREPGQRPKTLKSCERTTPLKARSRDIPTSPAVAVVPRKLPLLTR